MHQIAPPSKAGGANAPAALWVQGFGKNYGSDQTVQDVSFSIQGGELHGLLGPNGSGKSTVINGIRGVIPCDVGSIQILGHESSSLDAKPKMAYVPDELPMPASLSGNEYLGFTARLSPTTNRHWQRTLVEIFDLEPHLGKYVSDCSHGTKKKIQIVAYRSRAGGILLATHDLAFADVECSHVTILDRGRVVASGSPAELRAEFDRPSLPTVFLHVSHLEDKRARTALRVANDWPPLP